MKTVVNSIDFARPEQQISCLARLNMLTVIFFIFAGLLVYSNGHAVVPGNLRSYTTIHSIGMEWDISSDADHDAVCTVEYRKTGTTEWKTALPLYRVDFNSADMLAGSIFFLEPGTVYDVKLALSDQDGGSSDMTISAETRSIPKKPSSGRTFFVIPDSGVVAVPDPTPSRASLQPSP